MTVEGPDKKPPGVLQPDHIKKHDFGQHTVMKLEQLTHNVKTCYSIVVKTPEKWTHFSTQKDTCSSKHQLQDQDLPSLIESILLCIVDPGISCEV